MPSWLRACWTTVGGLWLGTSLRQILISSSYELRGASIYYDAVLIEFSWKYIFRCEPKSFRFTKQLLLGWRILTETNILFWENFDNATNVLNLKYVYYLFIFNLLNRLSNEIRDRMGSRKLYEIFRIICKHRNKS